MCSLGKVVSKDLMSVLTVVPGSVGVMIPLPLPLVRKLPGAFWDTDILHHRGLPSESERLITSFHDLSITKTTYRDIETDHGRSVL